MSSTQAGAPSSGAGDVSPGGNGNSPTANSKMRKRTKTGCLTCRKRRIKCGEERPTCANCIKSKRQCEGYNQRVVFKPPMGDWPNHPGVVSTLQYHNSMLPGSRASFPGPQSSTQPQDGPMSTIHPRPITQFDFSNIETPVSGLQQMNNQSVLVGGPQPYPREANYPQPLHSPQHQLPTPTSASSYFPTEPSPVHPSFHGHYAQDRNIGYPLPQGHPQGDPYQHIPSSYETHADAKPAVSPELQEQGLYQHQQSPVLVAQAQSYYSSHPATSTQAEEYPQYADHRSSLTHYSSHSQYPVQQPLQSPVDFSQGLSYGPQPAISRADSTHSSFQPVQIPQHDVNSDVKYMPQHAPVLEQPIAVAQTQQPQLLLSGFAGDDHVSPTQVLDEAAVEYEDDDYWDVESDEEMVDREDQDEDTVALRRDFSLIHKIHRENTSDLSMRRYDAFIYEGILTHYKAENVANPLKNPKTARVFAHFIHVTGPTLSIYERNPRNPASLFETFIPPSQQGLWTYVLPLKALNNQGLLHAMLALASLHIAKLQRASVTPSYKHYAYALKRLGRSLGHPKKRLTIPTLATSLLLAFYEVMTAEHVKWSTHLVGAAQLLAELDFRSLTLEARRLRAAQTAQEQQFPHQNPEMLIDQKQFDQRLKQSTLMPDASLVSTIVGKQVNYDDFGRVVEEEEKPQENRRNPSSKLDLQTYETLQDLYWWYARHDMFQSIVSGNPLIMDYRKWSDCPPRAPLGRTDALIGTHDHIILLVGRIADFTVRDRTRKIAQVEANGGHWIPTPGIPGMGGMGPPPPHQQQQAQGERGQAPPTPTTPVGPPPHMQGMGPPPGWTGPPPPGWTGGPPAGAGGGPPPGWTGPPPPGWKGEGPPSKGDAPPSSSGGPPPGWTGPPPPGWKGEGPQSSGGGPPPGWTGPPPPGWKGDAPPSSSGRPPPGWQGPPPPGWKGEGPPKSGGGSPPGWTGPPPPGWKGGPPPGVSQGKPGGPPSPSAAPDFYGMAPSRPNTSLPSSYAKPKDSSHTSSPRTPTSPNTHFPDLPAAYEAALTDWNAIAHAHATVATFLANTPSFQPLSTDLHPLPPPVRNNTTPFGPALVYRSYDISVLWSLLHTAQILLLRSHPGMPPAAMVAANICAPATQPYAILIGRISSGMHLPLSEDAPLSPILGAALIESTMSLFFAGVQYQDAAQREWLITRLVEIDRRTGWASAGVIARAVETSWQKTADLGRGAPYQRRRTRPFGEDEKSDMDADGSGSGGWGGDNVIRNSGKGDGKGTKGWAKGDRGRWEGEERRFVVRYKGGFVPWAMNLLATEEDLRLGMEGMGIGGEINVAGRSQEEELEEVEG